MTILAFILGAVGAVAIAAFAWAVDARSKESGDGTEHNQEHDQ